MKIRVDILDSEGEKVARLVWSGKLYVGKMTIRSEPGREERVKQIRDLFAARLDLRSYRFRSVGSRSEVKGWSGFEGAFGAARMALPALGMSLGDASVVRKNDD